MSANPYRIKVIMLTAIAWVAVMAFILPNLGHGSAVDEAFAAFAAAWHLLSLWFIRLANDNVRP